MKKLIIAFCLLSFGVNAQKKVDTTEWELDRKLAKKFSDSLGDFETSWTFVNQKDSVGRLVIVEKQYVKSGLNVMVRRRRTVFEEPKRSKKELFIDSLTK